jgi:long-subunit acyl-CoA synthetase (AMP-forming)
VLADQSLTEILSDGLALAKLDYTPGLYAMSSGASHCAPWKPFNLGNIIATGAESPDSLKTKSSNLAFICFSSGTTGPMKGVYLTHDNIVTNIFQHRQRLPELFKSDQTIAALITPFFHILGLGVFVCQYICQVTRSDSGICNWDNTFSLGYTHRGFS